MFMASPSQSSQVSHGDQFTDMSMISKLLTYTFLSYILLLSMAGLIFFPLFPYYPTSMSSTSQTLLTTTFDDFVSLSALSSYIVSQLPFLN